MAVAHHYRFPHGFRRRPLTDFGTLSSVVEMNRRRRQRKKSLKKVQGTPLLMTKSNHNFNLVPHYQQQGELVTFRGQLFARVPQLHTFLYIDTAEK